MTEGGGMAGGTADDSWGETRLRLVVALVGIPACFLVVWAGDLVFVAGITLLAGVGAWEYVRMFEEGPARPFLVPGIAAAALLPVAAWAQGPSAALWLTVPYLLAISAYALAVRAPDEAPVTSTALTVFGALYLGGLLGFSVPLRTELVEGRLAGTLVFFFPVVVTWIADSSAYFGGRRYGSRQLAPRLSPNKTVEGAGFQLAASTAAGAAYGLGVLGPAGYEVGPGRAVLLGAAVGGAAVLGDLVESALKRECGVKDASDLLPGHGGLLDRLDSLLWAFPVSWLILTWA